MQQQYASEHRRDADGNPAGGRTELTLPDGRIVIQVTWQDGPLGRVGTDEREEPNGAFVETLIDMARDRIAFYQADTRFSCRENALAITKLEEALHWLHARTARRTTAGVEGTHQES